MGKVEVKGRTFWHHWNPSQQIMPPGRWVSYYIVQHLFFYVYLGSMVEVNAWILVSFNACSLACFYKICWLCFQIFHPLFHLNLVISIVYLLWSESSIVYFSQWQSWLCKHFHPFMEPGILGDCLAFSEWKNDDWVQWSQATNTSQVRAAVGVVDSKSLSEMTYSFVLSM